jgi:hypothetical protein
VRLVELEPRWVSPNVFCFKCPHCKEWLLTCKNIEMAMQAQFDLYEQVFGADWNEHVVPAKESTCWAISGADFDQMTVTPSVDASASGHWHGHITDGEIK